MSNYRTVRLPEELVETVLDLIKEQKELGYRSHSEFIIDAVRRRVEKLLNKNERKIKNAQVQF
ncbi:MAG: ribbon-helix-helix domain-containing protein [Candidatus Lokiarchaeia archaeon]